ncbi:DUF11 domain-containing protein [bacterium]|nr:DUF11 domain-containing protein [bacterium]
MKRATLALALGSGLTVAAAFGVAAAASAQQAPVSHVEILSDRSLLGLAPAPADRGGEATGALTRLVALPPDATWAEARVTAGPAAARASARLLGRLRGTPVALLTVSAADPAALGAAPIAVELRHDGDWRARATGALGRHSRGFESLLAETLPARAEAPATNGAYLIVTTTEYVDALAPLVDWKRRKGFDVQLVTTAQTGASAAAIQAWIRAAYASWANPPEYLLIVGDVEDVPTWDFSDNPTDLPYALMDTGDWLPDLLLGRIPVKTSFELATVVAKTIAYERAPGGSNPDWMQRYLMVAGNFGSETPVSTVKFFGEQLARIGFENAFTLLPPYDGVYFPPIFGAAQAVPLIRNTINSGVGIVAYRGWAYGTAGWEPPHFIDEDIPSLANGAMTPVVMSFVCLNGNFKANEDCFGEAWLKAGTPSEPKGAVAFIGNGEHWSHTRYNDAMAIAFAERIVDPTLRDLGAIALAGKLRFMDYFPHQLDDTGNEESVEFYVHIYNLLGDPELNLWRAAPAALAVTHPASLPVGANNLELTVTSGGLPLAGARVGLVQGETLLGAAFSDAAGLAHLTLSPVAASGELALTVTAPDHRAYEAALDLTTSGAFLGLASYTLDDAAGNADGNANPGETLNLTVTLRNAGAAAASAVSATLGAPAGAVIVQGTTSFADIAAGASAEAASPFTVALGGALEDGQRLRFTLTASHDGGTADVSDLIVPVVAPALAVSATAFGDPGYAAPGQSVSLALTLANTGHLATGALTGSLALLDPELGSVTDAAGAWPALGVGASGDNAGDTFTLAVDADVPHGKSLPLLLTLTDANGYSVALPLALPAGLVNPAAPVGPDAYGYYAYDSADLFYTERPAYTWQELSPLFGGSGTELVFNFDNEVKPMLPLPFDFVYYGRTVSSLRIFDNGWITFDNAGGLDFYNWNLPNQHGNHSVIAPFYDNLTTQTADSLVGSEYIDGIYHQHDALAGTFTVEWSRVRHFRPEITDLQSFQVVLYDPAVHPTASGDGEIAFFYRQVNNSDYARGYATVGMEDDSETMGLQLSYSGLDAPGMLPLSPGLAVKLTTEPPVYDAFRLDAFTATPAATGLALAWSTRDARPVTGWRLWRATPSGETLVAELPAGQPHCLDAGADPARDELYRLEALHPYDLVSSLGPFHSLAEEESPGALRLSLGQSLPNPMRERARIDFALPAAGPISLKIYDAGGRLLRALAEGELPAGPASPLWDGRDDAGRQVPAGIYFYRLRAGGEVLTRKLLVIR